MLLVQSRQVSKLIIEVFDLGMIYHAMRRLDGCDMRELLVRSWSLDRVVSDPGRVNEEQRRSRTVIRAMGSGRGVASSRVCGHD